MITDINIPATPFLLGVDLTKACIYFRASSIDALCIRYRRYRSYCLQMQLLSVAYRETPKSPSLIALPSVMKMLAGFRSRCNMCIEWRYWHKQTQTIYIYVFIFVCMCICICDQFANFWSLYNHKKHTKTKEKRNLCVSDNKA